MLNKLFYLALLTTPSLSFAEELTITPDTLTSGTAYITWNEDYSQLTSWELSFTLSIVQNAEGSIFETRKGTYAANPHLVLSLTDNQVLLTYKEKKSDDGTTLLSCDCFFSESCHITLSFIGQQNAGSDISNGILTLQVNNSDASLRDVINITDANYLAASALHNNTSSSTSYNYINTNEGNIQFSDSALYRLDNLTIPEPTTATLSLVGLLSLLSRRKRKQI